MSKVSPSKGSRRQNFDPDMHGHANIRADVCSFCKGKLKAPDGSYCETFYDDGVVAFGAAICRQCKESLLRPKSDESPAPAAQTSKLSQREEGAAPRDGRRNAE